MVLKSFQRRGLWFVVKQRPPTGNLDAGITPIGFGSLLKKSVVFDAALWSVLLKTTLPWPGGM